MLSDLLRQDSYMRKAESIVNAIGIPAQSRVMLEINNEINNPNADVQSISDLIIRDVATSARLLKVINSPYFGMQEKIDSIPHALAMMGLENFKKIILASSLREVVSSSSQISEKFWNHSMNAALIASMIADRTGYDSADQAYTAALFHDCGIPLLMNRFKDYGPLVDYALSVAGSDALSGVFRSIIGVEDERFSIHHCAVGHLVAKSWHLSEPVVHAIWYHHYTNIDCHEDPGIKRLCAILLLSDYLASHLLYLAGGPPVEPEDEWARMHEKVMQELEMDIYQIKDLREESDEMLLQDEKC